MGEKKWFKIRNGNIRICRKKTALLCGQTKAVMLLYNICEDKIPDIVVEDAEEVKEQPEEAEDEMAFD